MGFLKFAAVRRKRVRSEAEGCGTAESLEQPPGQAVEKIVVTAMENVGAQRLRQVTKETDWTGFSTDECSVGTR